jgi:membrane AbrB-like protein
LSPIKQEKMTLFGKAAERAFAIRALVVGAGGGCIADFAGLPLAWMLGAIAACAAFALGGIRLAIPPGLRRIVLSVIGLYLGAAFSPELFAGLHRAPATLAALFVFSVLLAATLAVGFRRFLPTDALTAYCAGAPGVLALMVVLAREKGGDERITALAQIVRVVAVVVIIPLWVRAAADAPPATTISESDADAATWAIAAAILAVGLGAGALAKSAPVYLLAPMFLSGALHTADLISLSLPRAPLSAALVVLGASIGARFGGDTGGASAGSHAKIFIAAVIAALIAVAATALGALASAAALDESFWKMLLILAPGGIAEMCLIAVVLDIDPPLIALHQAARVVALLTLSPLIAARLARGTRE